MFILKLFTKLITFVLVLILAFPTFAFARTWLDARNTSIDKADAIVVMGAAQLDGHPGEVLEARLREAKRIYENDYAKRLFTLGAGAPGDRFTEAGTAREWLGRNGIPRKSITAIRIGRDSYTSIEGLAKTVDAAKFKKIIIVTDPYHCLRSKTMAADFGFQASCSPVRSGIASVDKAGIRYLVREAGAYLAYITLGRW
ncbi:MAG: YdcF family protein [Actinobacteria bacterium]|nr:YdcF family protein [Actinomycetota bacterium]